MKAGETEAMQPPMHVDINKQNNRGEKEGVARPDPKSVSTNRTGTFNRLKGRKGEREQNANANAEAKGEVGEKRTMVEMDLRRREMVQRS